MFNKLTIEDYQSIKPYLDDANYYGYNSNFNTFIMWDHAYDSYYHMEENFLIITCCYREHFFVVMPFCKKEHLKEAFEFLLSWSKDSDIPFEMSGVTEEVKEFIQINYPDHFKIIEQRDTFDYIYDANTMRSLAGKKMQKKRNHYNSFISEYEGRFEYKRLERSDFDACKELMIVWESNKDDNEFISEEHAGIYYIFDNYERLGFVGSCIYIDNKLEAFTLGSLIYHDTVQIHVEKANYEIRGLFVAIQKMFLEHEFPMIERVNREDDMGIESMRKAKLAYYPIDMIKKYKVVRSGKIRQATLSDKTIIKDIWQTTFVEDSNEYVDFYFDNIYNAENTYVYEIEGKIVSVIQLNQLSISLSKQIIPVSYIVGVVTLDPYRGNGYMKELMNYCLEVIKNEKQQLIAILKAYDWSLYRQFGFEIAYENALYTLNANDLVSNNPVGEIEEIEESNIHQCLELYNTYTKDKDGFKVRELNCYLIKTRSNQIEQIDFNLFKLEDRVVGYYEGITKNEEYIVYEFIFIDNIAKREMINYLLNKYSVVKILTDTGAHLAENFEILPNMMIKVLDYDRFNEIFEANIQELQFTNNINKYIENNKVELKKIFCATDYINELV